VALEVEVLLLEYGELREQLVERPALDGRPRSECSPLPHFSHQEYVPGRLVPLPVFLHRVDDQGVQLLNIKN
jgi:hypothetical protein